MHFTTILVALSAALASGAAIERSEPVHQLSKRGCYSGGEDWGDQLSNALTKAEDFCKIKPADLNEGEGYSKCYDLSNTKRVDFNVGNKSNKRRNLSYNDCYDGLQKEIKKCGNGGSSSYTNWKYRCVLRAVVGDLSDFPADFDTVRTPMQASARESHVSVKLKRIMQLSDVSINDSDPHDQEERISIEVGLWYLQVVVS